MACQWYHQHAILFIEYALLLMCISQQIVNSLHGVERSKRHLYKYGIPVAHGTVP